MMKKNGFLFKFKGILGENEETYYSRSVPRRTAMSWYSWRVRATSSGQPRVLSWLAATREARVSPGKVTTGVPVHSTSMLVVWPLHSGVSKQTSASWPRLTCSSLAATLLNKIRPGESPSCCAVACKFGSPTAGNLNSHRTEFGTCLRIWNIENTKIHHLQCFVSQITKLRINWTFSDYFSMFYKFSQQQNSFDKFFFH